MEQAVAKASYATAPQIQLSLHIHGGVSCDILATKFVWNFRVLIHCELPAVSQHPARPIQRLAAVTAIYRALYCSFYFPTHPQNNGKCCL